MRTLDGKDIAPSTRGVLYICDLTGDDLEVRHSIQFKSSSDALIAYAEIPNPESQLAMGNTKDEFKSELKTLHEMMQNPQYIELLKESI